LNSNDIKKKFKAAVKASKLLANDLFVKQKEKEKDNTVMAEAIGA
jgi:hypothetical protein